MPSLYNEYHDNMGKDPNVNLKLALSFQLYGNNYKSLEAAAKELEIKLAEYNGIFDIRNSFSSGSQEIQLSIKPEAEALGLTLSDLGRQVRQAFYGEEAEGIREESGDENLERIQGPINPD